MSIEDCVNRLYEAGEALEIARKHADAATTELIQASEEYQRAAQHLAAEIPTFGAA